MKTNQNKSRRHALRMTTALALSAAILTGCNNLERLASMGEQPPLSPVENPTHTYGYQPVSMPMPAPTEAVARANSLWRPGSRAFLEDSRADDVGDIVTVAVAIADTASVSNSTARTRTTSEASGVTSLLGYEAALDNILPEAVNPGTLAGITGATNNAGTGTITRSETITLNVAAVVTQVLPNGNLVIHGRQETLVNYEVRELQIAGVIRPQDITSTNTVSYNDIAEARLAYGGRGHITDFQQPRWGTQIVDIILPF